MGSTQIVLFPENTVKAREGLTLRAFCQYDLGSRLFTERQNTVALPLPVPARFRPAAVQGPGSWSVWRPQIPDLHCCASTRRRPFHNSKLYASLEQEDTKVWQYSTDMLYLLFKQEEKTGKIEFPDV